MNLSEMTVTAFVDELASSSPAPGGGSIAALGGALAAGLASMVGELTVGREKYQAVQSDMQTLCVNGKAEAAALLKGMEDDTLAFNAFMDTLKLPKDTPEHKAARSAAMQNAMKTTVEVPLQTLTRCAAISKMALTAAREGNSNAVTDAGTAGQFARAAAIGAAYNVRVNLLSIKDADYVAAVRVKVAALMAEIDATTAELSAVLEKALG